MIERWFRTLKTELVYPNEYHSPRALRCDLADFITKYNDLRPHEALNYATPTEVYSSIFPAA